MRVFLLSIVSVVVPTAYAVTGLTDVPEEHPHITAIRYVYNEGIMTGYPDGSFRPTGLVNRAEFMKSVMTSFTSSADVQSCAVDQLPFPEEDVPKDSWFAPYVCSALQNGLITGYPDGTFR